VPPVFQIGAKAESQRVALHLLGYPLFVYGFPIVGQGKESHSLWAWIIRMVLVLHLPSARSVIMILVIFHYSCLSSISRLASELTLISRPGVGGVCVDDPT